MALNSLIGCCLIVNDLCWGGPEVLLLSVLHGVCSRPNANSEMVGKFSGVSKWRPLTSEFSMLNIRLPFNEV